MNINALMIQAKKMQKEMAKKQQEFDLKEFTHQTNGGAIEITMQGNFKLSKINIDEGLLDDKDMLEDLLQIAFNDSISSINKEKQKLVPKQMGGMF